MDNRDTYKRFSKFYDMFVAEFTKDLPVYSDFCRETDKILEVGCGSGRVLKALLDSGFNITGVDISLEMLELAQNKLKPYVQSKKLKLINHNFINSALKENYNKVLITFYTFNYLIDELTQLPFLKNIYSSMEPGGKIIMDLFYPRTLAKPEIEDKWQQDKTFSYEDEKISLRDKRRMLGKVEERIQVYMGNGWEEEIKTFRRYFSKDEISALLKEAGFINISFTDGYNGKALHTLQPEERTFTSFMVIAQK